MKHIDAEKLKELINKKWKELADKNVKVDGGKWDAEISTYLSVLRLIDSLQQDQDLIIINKKDWEAQEQFRKNKDFGKPLQQEQPEADLEKEEYVGVAESPLKTFQRVNEFEEGASYRH